jgi:hypothetical protein
LRLSIASQISTECFQDRSQTADGAPESLEALLASLNDLGLGKGEGDDDDPELSGLLNTMMNQLMSKEILYEPLKELAEGVSASTSSLGPSSTNYPLIQVPSLPRKSAGADIGQR